MKAIKINDEAYDYLKSKAKKDRRSIISTVDILIEESQGDTFENNKSNSRSKNNCR